MKLRDYLLKTGTSQAEFAKMVDIGRTHLSCVITGQRNCGPKLAQRIEEATKGEIRAIDLISGAATGYEGKAKRVAPKYVKSELVKSRNSGRKVLSLL